MSPTRRLVGLALIAMTGPLLGACYSLRPLGGVEPQPGARVAFDVNDAGRVALGGAMGPEIAQVEGSLVERDTTGYLLAVSSIRLLRGGEQVWSGEWVRLDSRYLAHGYQRQFSLGRSIGLGVVAIGGFTAFLITRSLVTGGSRGSETPGEDGDLRLVRP